MMIAHSRRTLRGIRKNIVTSLSVKAEFVLLTILGHSRPFFVISSRAESLRDRHAQIAPIEVAQ